MTQSYVSTPIVATPTIVKSDVEEKELERVSPLVSTSPLTNSNVYTSPLAVGAPIQGIGPKMPQNMAPPNLDFFNAPIAVVIPTINYAPPPRVDVPDRVDVMDISSPPVTSGALPLSQSGGVDNLPPASYNSPSSQMSLQ